MFGIMNMLGGKAGQKVVLAAVATIAAMSGTAMAHENNRVGPTLSQREIVQRGNDRDRCDDNGRVTRVWVPPVYENRCEKIWIEPVYEMRCNKIWIEPVYETRCEKIWVEPVYQTRCDRVWIEPIYETRCVTRFDPVCMKFVTVHERVCVRPGRWEEVHSKVLVSAGHFEEVRRQVCVREGRFEELKQRVLVREGRWQSVEKQVLVREGYWATKLDRSAVADRYDRNDRRPIEVVNPHVRF